jgi:hypothetical protein
VSGKARVESIDRDVSSTIATISPCSKNAQNSASPWLPPSAGLLQGVVVVAFEDVSHPCERDPAGQELWSTFVAT